MDNADRRGAYDVSCVLSERRDKFKKMRLYLNTSVKEHIAKFLGRQCYKICAAMHERTLSREIRDAIYASIHGRCVIYEEDLFSILERKGTDS